MSDAGPRGGLTGGGHAAGPSGVDTLDALLVEVAGRHGAALGGSRRPDPSEQAELVTAYAAIDQACLDLDGTLTDIGRRPDVRTGQVVGTAVLVSIRAREAVGLTGPPPFAGTLDEPPVGIVGGQAGIHRVDAERAALGARWLVLTDDGLRLPATLTMLLSDSSGVDKEASLAEHRDALEALTAAAGEVVHGGGAGEDPMEVSGALDWLLYDWLMAHRAGDSAAVELSAGRTREARMIVAAAATSVRLRRTFDPALSAAR
ncbi:hypothetical protein GCM10022199_00610 [Marihabitans asiaticum]|uniref:Uncharacterized protein n=1 Tax=Marihabitans asiaticum TaxID=415218 RepID=A0A560WGH6_9MICO|nr:hypothetical protein [Marihabitans asiaticum]TWD16656.1 hypothetical protein FB557_0188 [Marihabitans asiaticum]